MRCAILSRAGQVLANGDFFVQKDDMGELRLNFQTDGGRLIQGGIINADGDLTTASKILYRQFFELWGVSDLTLVAQPNR